MSIKRSEDGPESNEFDDHVEEQHDDHGSQPCDRQEEDLTEEVVEEHLILARVVEGDDGRLYLELKDPENAKDIDLERIDQVQIVNKADGSRVFVLEDTAQRDQLIAGKARARVESVIRRKEDNIQQQQPNEAGTNIQPQFEELSEEVVEIDAEITGDTYNSGQGQQEYFIDPKNRKNRIYGSHTCRECGQSFTNIARLERHLSVHQQHGYYVCSVCGKRYKYEYNLFYHWRKTCREMNELLSSEELRAIEINALRQLVEEIAQKKAALGSLNNLTEYRPKLSQRLSDGLSRTRQLTAQNLFGDNVDCCPLCNLVLYRRHLPRHLAIHRGKYWALAEPSVGGAFFCDLCSFMFRTRANLLEHWRSTCLELMCNIDSRAMNEAELKDMVFQLLKTKDASEEGEEEEEEELDVHEQQQFSAHQQPSCSSSQPGPSHASSSGRQLRSQAHQFGANIQRRQQIIVGEQQQPSTSSAPQQQQQQPLDEDWAVAEGIMFAEDLLDSQEGTLMIAEDGKLVGRTGGRGSGAENRVAENTDQQNAATISQQEQQEQQQQQNPVRGPKGEMKWIQYPKSVQCNQCFRSFSSLQRLEKHMAGAHYSIGTHHCLFCGSRFKYEYNLLFHYRDVCPYARRFLSDEARQQMEAADLKKTIRKIAAGINWDFSPNLVFSASNESETGKMGSSQGQQGEGGTSGGDNNNGTRKDINIIMPPAKTELGDSLMRRQMMKKIIQRHTPNFQKMLGEQQDPETLAEGEDSSSPHIYLPPVLLQPMSRGDLPDGNHCPICFVVFYGLKVLARHLMAAHPNSSKIWEKTLQNLGQESTANAGIGGAGTSSPVLRPSRLGRAGRKRKANAEVHGESEEPPPQLEMEG